MAERTSQVMPFSMYDSVDVEDLWAYMTAYEKQTDTQSEAGDGKGANFDEEL